MPGEFFAQGNNEKIQKIMNQSGEKESQDKLASFLEPLSKATGHITGNRFGECAQAH